MMPPSSLSKKPKIVLFDLDGTLADSAPDLAGAINAVRIERGLAPVPYEQLRPVASAGAPGLIKAAFQLTPYTPHCANVFCCLTRITLPSRQPCLQAFRNC